ncbi:MAG: 50S ribosomal protein L11 methyltransferase [Oscillospiraceae bacterium]|nr:50S ribosomal protein L11 methyltransferase [Oscillospiraceae bacterium]
MEWWEIAVDTAHDGLDAVCAKLAGLGIDSFSVQDGAAFAEDRRTAPDWELVDESLCARMEGLCRIAFYLPAGQDETVRAVRNALDALPAEYPGLPFGPLRVEMTALREEDWADGWKQYYKPLPIGRRLLIQPEWEPLGDTQGRVVFRNNPGMSFGTGEHETTRMCLQELDRLVSGGETVLDVGCGSGILSICALLLGAESADAMDIDPNAVAVARRNAADNGFAPDRYRAAPGNLLEPAHSDAWPGPYQLILANLVADLVIALAPTLARRLASGGRLIASGVIGPRRDEVVAALEAAGLRLEGESELRDWRCFVAGPVSR